MDILAKLFGSEGIVRLMRIFLFHPGASYDTRTLREKTNLSSPALRKTGGLLLRIGFIKYKGAKFVLNAGFPYLASLRELLISNLLQSIDIKNKIQKAGKFSVIFASGVLLDDREARTDLLLVGDRIDNKMLQKMIASIEADAGTELRYAFFTTAEYQYRLSINDKLIRDILDYTHVEIINKLT